MITSRIATTTSGGTSSIPWASRACEWIYSKSAVSSSLRVTQSHPGTTSPHLNCFI